MSRDDYFVIVYQILSYLYTCLKTGVKVDAKKLLPSGDIFSVNTDYWKYIICHIYEDGYISGITLTPAWGEEYPIVSDLEYCRITPKGIEYLNDNSLMKKAMQLLKDVKEMTPFV